MKRALIVIQGVLMAFASFFIVSFIFTMITSLFVLITGIQDINPEVNYCLMVMAVTVSIIIFLFWYKRIVLYGIVEGVDIKDILTFKNMAIYLMMGIGSQFFMSGILSLISPIFENLFDYYKETISTLFIADTTIVAMYVVILAPIIEELMLRGIMFNRLRQGLSFRYANLLQAVVFGIYHWDIIQGLYAFALGLLLGYIYEKTRTLLAPIIVHVIINGSGFLLQALEINAHIPIWLAIIAGGGLLFGGVYIFSKNNNFINKI